MPEARQQYRLSTLNVDEINIALSLIGDRLDQIEGIRGSLDITTTNIFPAIDATYDLGSTDLGWKDLYLTGSLFFDDSFSLTHDGTDFVFNDSLNLTGNLLPNSDATYDIGSTALGWRNQYLTGLLYFDDTNSLTHDGTDFAFNDSLKTTGGIFPATDDTYDLGSDSLAWHDIFVRDTIIMDKASSVGIKVDTGTPTFGFADIIGDQFTANTGATKPTMTVYNGTVDAFQFSDGDEAFLCYHIPHDYVPGTDIFLHVHWSQTSATATGGTLDFKYFSIYAKGHNQASGSTFTGTPITATFTSIDINDGGAGLSQYQHHLTEVQISGASATAALFDRDDFEPDGVILLTLEMDANNLTNSGAVLDPFIHFADLHYNTTGLIGTKAKGPDFYA